MSPERGRSSGSAASASRYRSNWRSPYPLKSLFSTKRVKSVPPSKRRSTRPRLWSSASRSPCSARHAKSRGTGRSLAILSLWPFAAASRRSRSTKPAANRPSTPATEATACVSCASSPSRRSPRRSACGSLASESDSRPMPSSLQHGIPGVHLGPTSSARGQPGGRACSRDHQLLDARERVALNRQQRLHELAAGRTVASHGKRKPSRPRLSLLAQSSSPSPVPTGQCIAWKAQRLLTHIPGPTGASPIVGFGREPLGQSLDFAQHAPLHHHGTKFHREHRGTRCDRRETEAVSADQPRRPAAVHQHEGSDPVPVIGPPGQGLSRLDQLKSHTV